MKQYREDSKSFFANSRVLFDLLKQSCEQYIFACDLQTKECMLSPNLLADFALPKNLFFDLDKHWRLLIHPDDREACRQDMQRIFSGKSAVYDRDYRVKNRRGEYIWVRCRGKAICPVDGPAIFFAGMITKLAQKSKVDALTGLLNKYQFEQTVKASLEAYRATGQGGALLIFGLDNFKIINETYNRFFGDAVLQQIAQRLEKVLPPELLLYKLDGDEFGIVYPGAGEAEIEELFQSAQRCTMLPQEIDQKMYFCTLSAGTVFFPQGGKEYLVLYKHAEAALDMAKKQGKNKNYLFSKEQYNRWVRSISMRDDLKRSVENDCEGFELFFQPQVMTASRTLCGAEALLRWRNYKGKMVAPMEFIHLLEETKLIIPVGKWVFEKAVSICKKWQALLPDFHISINVSYEQLKDSTFKEFVPQCIARYGIRPETITLELTESCIVADWSFVNRTFDFFRQQGLSIAMDDFGTGYSSLSYLKNLSTDIVKIDREFVRKILCNDFDKKLVKYTVQLCHSVGMKVCIEGVESREEYRLLHEECEADMIQGYLFGHPESEADFVQKFIIDKENLRVEV